jgi:hypothetical protein
VIGDGAEQADLVRLTFTGGSAIEDTVKNGVVLFFASRSPLVPMFDQLTEAEWSGATHKRSSFRTPHPASHMITNFRPRPHGSY